MTDRERRLNERAQRVQNFFDAPQEVDNPASPKRRAAFDPTSTTTARLVEFDSLVGTGATTGLIDKALAHQQGGSGAGHGDVDSKSALADILRADLEALTSTAAELDIPGIRAKFAPPTNSGYTALRKAVLAALENLTPAIKTALLAEELEPTFEQDLREDLRDFDAAEDDEDQDLDKQVQGTRGLGQLLARTSTLTRKFDVAVRNKFKRTPTTLRAWEVASKLERAPQRQKKPTPPATPPQA